MQKILSILNGLRSCSYEYSVLSTQLVNFRSIDVDRCSSKFQWGENDKVPSVLSIGIHIDHHWQRLLHYRYFIHLKKKKHIEKDLYTLINANWPVELTRVYYLILSWIWFHFHLIWWISRKSLNIHWHIHHLYISSLLKVSDWKMTRLCLPIGLRGRSLIIWGGGVVRIFANKFFFGNPSNQIFI